MVHAIFNRELEIEGDWFLLRKTFWIPRVKYCAVLDSSQSNNASWKAMKEILQTKLTMKSKYQKVS